MQPLDDTQFWERLDPGEMRRVVETFPEQIRKGAGIASAISFAAPSPIQSVVLAGLGGSAIGGDVVRSIVGDRLRVPFLVNRDYGLPAFVGPKVPVIASSYSGNTEETLSACRQAQGMRAPIICITSGGQLAELAQRDGWPLVLIPSGLQPRAALGYSTLAVLGCLRSLGLLADMAADIEETAGILDQLVARYGGPVPTESNTAKRMAVSIHGSIAAIYSSAGILDAAAVRWRAQIEENAKNLAFHHLLPEMNHNELVGWELPGAILRQIVVIMLRDRDEHPQVQKRFELTREILSAKAGALHQVWSQGESRLARIFSVMFTGDFVSLYLAGLNGVDPTPVKVIESLKRKLGK